MYVRVLCLFMSSLLIMCCLLYCVCSCCMSDVVDVCYVLICGEYCFDVCVVFRLNMIVIVCIEYVFCIEYVMYVCVVY